MFMIHVVVMGDYVAQITEYFLLRFLITMKLIVFMASGNLSTSYITMLTHRKDLPAAALCRREGSHLGPACPSLWGHSHHSLLHNTICNEK